MEVLGRYSNHADQGKRLRRLVSIVPKATVTVNGTTNRQVHRRLSESQAARLANEYLAGATTYELADRFRIGRDNVMKVLERQGVPRRYRSPTSAEITRAAELPAITEIPHP